MKVDMHTLVLLLCTNVGTVVLLRTNVQRAHKRTTFNDGTTLKFDMHALHARARTLYS